MCTSVVLISSYGALLTQRVPYLALHSSLFGPDGAVNSALILCQLAQDVVPMVHTLNIVEPIWPMLQNVSKTVDCTLYIFMYGVILIYTHDVYIIIYM